MGRHNTVSMGRGERLRVKPWGAFPDRSPNLVSVYVDHKIAGKWRTEQDAGISMTFDEARRLIRVLERVLAGSTREEG